MSELIRWQPINEMVTLRDAMDHLFNEAVTRPWGLSRAAPDRMAPSVDMFETENEVIVKAGLPGIKAGQVDINVTGEMLTIKGEHDENQGQDRAYHIREQRWGRFERSMLLPTAVIADRARAEFEDGVLTITLPKADAVKPKTIPVKGK